MKRAVRNVMAFFYSVRVIHDNIPSVRDIYIIYSLIVPIKTISDINMGLWKAQIIMDEKPLMAALFELLTM